MLPEPNAGKSAATPARPQPGVMTPLFAVPGGPEPDATPAAGRRVRPAARTRQPRRASPRLPAADSGPRKDTADLLTVTAERLRRALGRSFLRYGIASDLEAAVHAAMNVIEPVLDARDTEILRLRRMMAGKVPGKSAR